MTLLESISILFLGFVFKLEGKRREERRKERMRERGEKDVFFVWELEKRKEKKQVKFI